MVDIKWEELGFSYIKTPYRFIAHWQDGAWDEGVLSEDNVLHIHEGSPRFTMVNSVLKVLKLTAEKMAISIFSARSKIANG